MLRTTFLQTMFKFLRVKKKSMALSLILGPPKNYLRNSQSVQVVTTMVMIIAFVSMESQMFLGKRFQKMFNFKSQDAVLKNEKSISLLRKQQIKISLHSVEITEILSQSFCTKISWNQWFY